MSLLNGRGHAGAESRPPRPFASSRSARLIDRIVAIGIGFLIVATPPAVDAYEPWQFSLTESVILLLIELWMVRALLCPESGSARRSTLMRGLGIPLLLFAGLVGFQLIHFPPSVLNRLSPATYQVYLKSLSGWPNRVPYDGLVPSSSAIPGSTQSSRTGAKDPAASHTRPQAGASRAISLAPGVTRRVALKFLAFGCLFFLAAFYPFGFVRDRRGVADLCRRAVMVVLITGLVVGLFGVLSRLTDNGETLWLFVSQTHQRGDLWAFRATGPYVNPDHFANYIDLVLPFAIAGLLFPASFISRKYEYLLRWLAGFAAVVLIAALVGSASRAGWIGAVISLACLMWLCGYMPERMRPRMLRLTGRSRLLVPLLAVAALVAALIVAGPFARTQADSRLSPTAARDDFGYRWHAAEDSLQMVRDFPLFGVGLGCWAELFPRYGRPPWSSVWWGETHNDYVQLVAEMGIVGLLCLAWFFGRLGRELYAHTPPAESAVFPIFAAIVSAVAATAFHEFFDFPLHLSANAFLLALWLAMALRIAFAADASNIEPVPRRWKSSFLYAGTAAAAIVLAFAAFTQGDEPVFPYKVDKLQTPAAVRAFILAHPGNSRAHLMLLKLMGEKLTPDLLDREAQTALWLEPINPLARDIHARVLFARNQRSAALEEIGRSVFFSPDPATHFYLAPDRIAGLSAQERDAVERGFQTAVARHFPDAAQGLGNYYQSLGEPARAAAAYLDGAAQESDPAIRTRYLMTAGLAFSQARNWSDAEGALRKAIGLSPDNPAPYQALIDVYGSTRKMGKTKSLIRQAREQGVDPFPLYSALAQFQMNSGDSAGAMDSLLRAVKYRPGDFMTLFYLGELYSQRQQFDRAAMWFKRAAAADPRSVDALAALAGAEQSSYDYFEAECAYKKAIKLAPRNAGVRRAYEDLERKVQQAQADHQKLQ